MADEGALRAAAIEAVLTAIAGVAGSGKAFQAAHVLDLAEAYAWLAHPDQAHGRTTVAVGR